jgi:hypothetical protein
VTLWGDTAASFNFKALEESTTAVFVVFTSLKVKKYDGNHFILNYFYGSYFILNFTKSNFSFINTQRTPFF